MPKRHPQGRSHTKRSPRRPPDPFDLFAREFGGYLDDVDPAEAELALAQLLTDADPGDDNPIEPAEAVLRIFIPEMLQRPSRGAYTLLTVAAHLLDGGAARAARLAAAGIRAEGIEPPAWLVELDLAVTSGEGVRARDGEGVVSLIGADLHRGHRGYTAILAVSHLEDDRAVRVILLPEAGLAPTLLGEMVAGSAADMTMGTISGAEFRGLARRAVARAEPMGQDGDPIEEDEAPTTAACALVLGAWLRGESSASRR